MTQLAIDDALQRQTALDPMKSFIVQAPAGSGKTELLTQRFLVLLSHIQSPEEILAITFTKKSAEEMRTRILAALNNALGNTTEPSAAHEKLTWQLANQVLAQDKKLQWNLLVNPNRLRIQTIDSLNASLTRQLPILSQFGSNIDIADDIEHIYQEAVNELLAQLEDNVPWADDLAQLLLHLDNDLTKLQTLLINMLAKRDQWLPYIMLQTDDNMLRSQLEAHLYAINTEIITKLLDNFPSELLEETEILLNYTNKVLIYNNKDYTKTHKQQKSFWQKIKKLLLTDKFSWRKSFDIRDGFPAPSTTKNLAEKAKFKCMIEHAKKLTNQLNNHHQLVTLFKELEKSPAINYNENQWQTLQALHQVLRIAVAQLKLTFQRIGKIDYIENALAALLALGTDDAPTDLALALDYHIKHILIDEFQDTARGQFRLVEKLTLGWEQNDGRTLFLVGDPMQSIYRFREADVGLFIRARTQGIGQVRLIPLTLTVNFRSLPRVVNWVNEHFTHDVFPKYNDIATGAVSFSQSLAFQQDEASSGVVLHHTNTSNNEHIATTITESIQTIRQQHVTDSIAILVRSRSHLTSLIPALKAAGISYCAIDIDPLASRPAIQDALALTRALLQPADRIAWLAILRAPWCGLTLEDLLKLCINESSRLIWQQLQNNAVIEKMSIDGQQRIARILPILNNKMYQRCRHSLRTMVESTWQALGGPACVTQITDIDDMNAFFALLDKIDNGGDILQIHRLEEHIAKLFASPATPDDNAIQIMTIHNAKGLEFDHVIVPHLERKASSDEKQLMLWMEQSAEQSDHHFILAPVDAIGKEKDTIYDYIKHQHTIKSQYEMGRLLYVAATRAKKSLHLHFNLKVTDDATIENPSKNSLLNALWPAIQQQIVIKNLNPTDQVADTISTKHWIKRLPLSWKNPHTEDFTSSIVQHQKPPGFLLSQNNPKIIGTLIHQILQQLSIQGINWWNVMKNQQKKSYIERHLKQAGLASKNLATAYSQIHQAITNTLNDERGQWILANYASSAAELPLTTVIDGNIHSLIIDRTFVDDNDVRWIIDYKNTHFPGDDLPGFLAQEEKNHREQLELYYLAMREIENRPIKLGLYFPLIPAWLELST